MPLKNAQIRTISYPKLNWILITCLFCLWLIFFLFLGWLFPYVAPEPSPMVNPPVKTPVKTPVIDPVLDKSYSDYGERILNSLPADFGFPVTSPVKPLTASQSLPSLPTFFPASSPDLIPPSSGLAAVANSLTSVAALL
jgi:hypothetical protein